MSKHCRIVKYQINPSHFGRMVSMADRGTAWGRRCGIKTQDWPAGATSTRPRANARGRRCGIKTQDWPAGATSTRTRANAQGRRCGIKTLGGGGNLHEEPEALPGAEDTES